MSTTDESTLRLDLMMLDRGTMTKMKRRRLGWRRIGLMLTFAITAAAVLYDVFS